MTSTDLHGSEVVHSPRDMLVGERHDLVGERHGGQGGYEEDSPRIPRGKGKEEDQKTETRLGLGGGGLPRTVFTGGRCGGGAMGLLL